MGLILAVLSAGALLGALAVFYKRRLQTIRMAEALLARPEGPAASADPARTEAYLRELLWRSQACLYPLGEAYALRRLAQNTLDQCENRPERAGKLQDARGLYEQVLEAYTRLWVRAARPVRKRVELAHTHAGLARVAERLGEWDVALREAHEARQLFDAGDEEERESIDEMTRLADRARQAKPRASGGDSAT